MAVKKLLVRNYDAKLSWPDSGNRAQLIVDEVSPAPRLALALLLPVPCEIAWPR